jgi:hypothetical protein
MFGPAAENRVAGVARVVQNRPYRTALPAVRMPVTVLLWLMRRRTRNPVPVKHAGDCPITVARLILPRADPGRHRVVAVGRDGHAIQPALTGEVTFFSSGSPRTDLW